MRLEIFSLSLSFTANRASTSGPSSAFSAIATATVNPSPAKAKIQQRVERVGELAAAIAAADLKTDVVFIRLWAIGVGAVEKPLSLAVRLRRPGFFFALLKNPLCEGPRQSS